MALVSNPGSCKLLFKSVLQITKDHSAQQIIEFQKPNAKQLHMKDCVTDKYMKMQ